MVLFTSVGNFIFSRLANNQIHWKLADQRFQGDEKSLTKLLHKDSNLEKKRFNELISIRYIESQDINMTLLI